MAIEKMMFVRATGPIEKLNEFNLKTLTVDYYHPETAIDYLSGADGYHTITSACPFEKAIKQIEEISKIAEVSITSNTQNSFSSGSATPEYIKNLTRYVSENDFDSSDITSFISGLRPAVEKNSAIHKELILRKKQLNDRIDQLKHFAALDVDPNEVMGTSYIDVHFGSLPKDSMVKLYMYNTDNKLIFNTYSSDEKYFWGVYCVSKKYAKEAEKIMEALYFNELKFDPNEGSVPQVIEKCRKELDSIIISQTKINMFWEENKAELTKDYTLLLDLEKLWSFRKYAVVKNDTFCCIGWIPRRNEKEARQLFSEIKDVEFTIKDQKYSVTASGMASSSPFERPIRDIEHLSHHVSYDLTPDILKCTIGTSNPLTDAYIKKLTRYLGGADISSDSNSLVGLKADIHSLSEYRKTLKKREAFLQKKIRNLKHFTSLDIDISELYSVSYSVSHFGRLPIEYAETARKTADEKGFIFNICSSDEKYCWGFYFTPKKYANETEKFFSSMYFKEYSMTEKSGLVTDIIENCDKELQKIAKEKQNIADFWHEHKDDIIDSYSILQDLQHLWNLKNKITLKNGKYIYSGSSSSADKKKILTLYEAVGGFAQELDSGSSPDKTKLTPPSKLKNNFFAAPYEYYVKMYGMPTYGGVDITSFVAATYTLLFGIMFGDLGQGFILAAGGLLAWKIKKLELGKILIPCGVSSMIFGFVFGSVFGFEEMLDPVYHAIGMKGKPIHVMDSVNTVLLLAIGIGIALVTMSILINIYSNLKAKKYGASLFDNNGLAGLILYLCGVSLVIDFMANITIIPTSICITLLIISAIILFTKEILIGIVDKHPDWKPHSIGDFIAQNIFEMLEYVLSYFSNTVSFLRVGAFVLVHAGMMMVVFSLAGESENLFVIILGNILVICLEGLLTGIQALRLEFYEMFSRCFEGNGKPFISAKSLLDSVNKNK